MVRFDGRSVYRWGAAAITVVAVGWAAEARAAFAVGGTSSSGSVVTPASLLEAGVSGQLIGGGSEIAVVSGIAYADTQEIVTASQPGRTQASVLAPPGGLSPGDPLAGGSQDGSTPPLGDTGGGGPAVSNPAPPGVVLALTALPALAAVRLLRRRSGQPAPAVA